MFKKQIDMLNKSVILGKKLILINLKVFLALLQLQGIVVKPHFWHYWTKKPLMDTPFLEAVM